MDQHHQLQQQDKMKLAERIFNDLENANIIVNHIHKHKLQDLCIYTDIKKKYIK